MRANPKPLLAPLFPQCEGICCFPWFRISVMTKEYGQPSFQGRSELHLGSSVTHLAASEKLAEDTPCGAPGRANRRAVHSSGSVLQGPCTGFAQEEEAEMCAKEMQLEEFQALECRQHWRSRCRVKISRTVSALSTGFVFPAQCRWKGSLCNRSGEVS